MKFVSLMAAAAAMAGAIPALGDVRIAVRLDSGPVLEPPALVFPDNTPITVSLANLFDHTGTPTGDYRLTIWVFDDAVFQQQQTSPTAQLPALTLLSATTDPLPTVFDIAL